MKTSVEIRFERLAEDFAPPAPKPEPAKSERVQYVSQPSDILRAQGIVRKSYPQPSDILRAQGIVRKSYPLTRIWVTLQVNEFTDRSVDDKTLFVSIYRQLAMRLADELMKQMEVRKDYDIGCDTTRYSAMLLVADPKVIGSSVEEYAMANFGV